LSANGSRAHHLCIDLFESALDSQIPLDWAAYWDLELEYCLEFAQPWWIGFWNFASPEAIVLVDGLEPPTNGLEFLGSDLSSFQLGI